MRIAIAGPVATHDLRHLLGPLSGGLPAGYRGAPFLATLIQKLLDRGHRLSVITTSTDLPPHPGKFLEVSHGALTVLFCGARPRAFRPHAGKVGRALDFFKIERHNILNAITHAKPDVVHAHWSYEFGLAAIESAIPHIITCHDSPSQVLRHLPGPYRFIRYLMARKCLTSATALTAVSPYLQSEIEKLTSTHIGVIPNPLPIVILNQPVPTSRVADARSPNICMVSNGWDRRKNGAAALNAFQLLRQKIPNAQFNIFGAGYEIGGKAAQWALANKKEIGVTFHGPLPHEKLLARLSGADVVLHPSLEETFGMSVAEAMGLKKPIVAGKHSGAIPWLVGEGGLLVDITRPEQMSDALHRLSTDPFVYERCASAGYERASAFSPDRVVDLYEKAYGACGI